MKALFGLLLMLPLQGDMPAHDITVAEMVDILADYNLTHVAPSYLQQHYGGGNYSKYYGMTDHDSQNMYIIVGSDRASRRGTVLHELMHVYFRQNAIEATEEQVLAEETRLYKKLFGR